MMRRMCTWDVCVRTIIVGAVCAVAQVALAGPVENVGDALIHPTDPDIITLTYENAGGGLIHTSDGGETWAIGCNSALGASREPFSLAMGGNGEVYLGFFGSMLADNGGRCAFDSMPEFDTQWVSDVTLHPDEPNLVLALTSGGDKENGIWRRLGSDAFEPFGARERVLISRVRVTALPGGGERYYETIARGETMEMVDGLPRFFPNYFVRSSEDDAQTWTEHAFPKTQGTMRLELIDPTDPDRLVVSVDNTREDETDFVLVSDDAGATFRELIEIEQFGGLALSGDGRLWVGDESGGLFAGMLTATTLQSMNTKVRPTCVRFDPLSERLYVCEDYGFGFYDEPNDSFIQLFDITQTEGFLDCAGVRDEVTACEEQMFAGYCGPSHYPGAPICWQNYPDRVPLPATGGSGGSGGGDPDAGGPGVPDGGGTAGSDDSDADSGCTVAGAGRPSGAGHALWLLVAAALGIRRLRNS